MISSRHPQPSDGHADDKTEATLPQHIQDPTIQSGAAVVARPDRRA